MIRWRLVSELGVESWEIGSRELEIEKWNGEIGNRNWEKELGNREFGDGK